MKPDGLIVRADDVAPQAWRNGGGRTRELLAWPGRDDPQLRISLAEIGRDGPFSAYEGRRRWFTVVDGAGVWLDFGQGPRQIGPNDAPVAFDGGLAPMCRLVAGPTRDLNLMHRGAAAVMATAQPGVAWLAGADQCGLFTAVAGHWRAAGAQALELPALTLLWLPRAPATPMSFAPTAPTRGPAGWWLAFTPHKA